MNKSKFFKASALAFVLSLGAGIYSATATDVADKATADELTPTSQIIGKSLSLDDNIYVLYAVDFENVLETDETGLLVWTAPQESYEYATAKIVLEESGKMTYNDVTYPTFSYNKLSAKQMTETIYASAYVERDGVYYYGEVEKYSILEYAYNKLDKTEATPTTDDNLKSLLNAMLSYGAAAQIYKGHNLDKLATDNFTYVRIENACFEDGFDYGLFEVGDEVKFTIPAGICLRSNLPEYIRVENGEYVLSVPTIEKVILPSLSFSEHTEVTDKAVTPTCSATGLTEGSHCSVCGETFVVQEIVSALGHTEVTDEAVTPTCSATGLTEGSHCLTCGETFVAQKVLPTVNHSFSDGLCKFCSALDPNYPASAGLTYTLLSDDTYAVSKLGICKDTDVVIPDTYKGKAVTSIGSSAFYNCTSLTNISIPDSVTSIGSNAFSNCSSLISISIPDSIVSIGANAFSNCSNLIYNNYDNGLYLGNENNSYLLFVKSSSISISSCIIHDTTKFIYSYAFSNCSSLTEITLPEGLISIGSYAFNSCSKLEKITIPTTLESIGKRAFQNCNGLKGVYIEDLNAWGQIDFEYEREYDEGWWYGCFSNPLSYAHNLYLNGELITNLTPESCRSFTFQGGHFTSVTIPDSWKNIPLGAFQSCSKLTEIILPDSVTSISAYAFDGCFPSVLVCNNVTSVDDFAIESSGLRAIYFKSTPNGYNDDSNYYAFQKAIYGYNCVTIGNGVYGIKDGEAMLVCYSKKAISLEIPTNITYDGVTYPVTAIGAGALENSRNLTSVTLPSSITKINDYAFYNCVKLVEVINESSLTITAGSSAHGYVGYYAEEIRENDTKIVTVDDYQFYTLNGTNYLLGYVGNDSLLSLPESYNGQSYEIYDYAFSNYANLISVTIPSNVTKIGNDAFGNCPNLQNVTIENGVTSIGYRAFYNCSNLTNITLPNSVTYISSYMFSNCKNLTEITLPDSIMTIESNAFSSCTNLTKISIPDSIKAIESDAFYGCSKLQYTEHNNGLYFGNDVNPYLILIEATSTNITFFTIPNTTRIIYNSAFYYCEKLSEIVIPDSVVFIGESAFTYCSGLTSVTFGNSLETIGRSAFSYCSNLTGIVLPQTLRSIGAYAFYNCNKLTTVTLGNTEGWTCSYAGYGSGSTVSLSSSNLTDPSYVAIYLKSTYEDYIWTRATTTE